MPTILCTYDNRSDEAVYYGLGADDEMCNLTLVYTPGSRSAECVVVATSDGQVP